MSAIRFQEAHRSLFNVSTKTQDDLLYFTVPYFVDGLGFFETLPAEEYDPR